MPEKCGIQPLACPSHTPQAFPNSRHMDAYYSDSAIYWPTLRRFFANHLGDEACAAGGTSTD